MKKENFLIFHCFLQNTVVVRSVIGAGIGFCPPPAPAWTTYVTWVKKFLIFCWFFTEHCSCSQCDRGRNWLFVAAATRSISRNCHKWNVVCSLQPCCNFSGWGFPNQNVWEPVANRFPRHGHCCCSQWDRGSRKGCIVHHCPSLNNTPIC